ncbi:acyl-CoA:6-aminopenicillanic-acid-acyltransferase [Schizopora paradoxa]|uniref:Acyl-CoA:6-aminopenicillanic-acid-acyltransferase n=1 Tax=Schizopora paradoxa TaxID=27342 RepID=A0A0H2RRI4_9AGAM|nr:acyl-CoA:6-aminopenicillanic-acid-acyltransferase [Schizopora paradoxa]
MTTQSSGNAEGFSSTTDSGVLPHVELSGTSFKIGFQHGNLLAPQILSQLDIYRGIFKSIAKLEWQEVLEVSKEFVPTIQRLTPHLFEEIQGIVAGIEKSEMSSEVGLLDIVALNARSEISLGLLNDGCTSLAWTFTSGSNAGSHRQVLAQNWDWTETVGKNLALTSIEQVGKPKIWMVTEPGIVGKIGFNSASVGLLPIHLVLRIALESTSVTHAIETLESLGGPASSQHILIADALAGSRGMEVSPLGSVYLEPNEHGVLVHTNHFLKNKFVDEPPWLEGSPVRLSRIGELCCASVTPDVLRTRIFADKFGAPQSICCYAPMGDRVMATQFNIIMVFEDGQDPYAEVVLGRPGQDNCNAVMRLPW